MLRRCPVPHFSLRDLRNDREASRSGTPSPPLLKPPPGERAPTGALRQHPNFRLTGTMIYQLSVSPPTVKLGPAEKVTGDPVGREGEAQPRVEPR